MQKILIVSVLLFYGFCYSQFSISGKITTSDSVSLANCHVHFGSKSNSTNSKGEYRIKNLPVGNLKIFVYKNGYQTIDSIIVVSKNTNLDFVLQAKATSLNEVVVKHPVNQYNQSVMEQKIKAETIEKYSNFSLGESLKEVAGVSVLRTGNNIVKPIISGLHSSRIPIIANNVRLEDQQWGSDHAPNFDVNSAAKITVIKGASALQYNGDAMGGLVIIEPLVVKKDTLFGKTMLSLASNGRGGTFNTSLHQGNDKNWSWNAMTTFKYFGDRTSPGYVLSNTGNREINFTGDIGFKGKDYDFGAFYSLYSATNGILRASHVGNSEDLYNAINNKIPFVVKDFTYDINNPKQQVQHHVAKLNFNRYFDESSVLSVQYSFQYNQRFEFDVRRGDANSKPALDLQLHTHTLNVDFKKAYHDWDLKTGVVGLYQSNFANPETGISALIPNFDKIDAGIYGLACHHFQDDLTFEAGIRYDFSNFDAKKFYKKSRWTERNYSPNFDHLIIGESGIQWLANPKYSFHNLSANVGIHKEFMHLFDWFVNLSLASRNPNPAEFFSDGLHHATGIMEQGDLELDKEKSYQFSTAIQKKWKSFSMSLHPFINNIQNYIFLKPYGFEFTNRGEFPVWEYTKTDALLAGFDFETQWKITENWQHQLTLAYVNGQDLTHNIPLIDMPPLTINNKIQFIKKEWNQLLLELKSEIVTQQIRFPDNNFYTIINVNGEQKRVLVDISTPPKGYHLLHFYSEMKLKTFKNVSTTLAFSIQNITNTAFRDYLNKQRLYADEMGRNFQIQLKFNY